MGLSRRAVVSHHRPNRVRRCIVVSGIIPGRREWRAESREPGGKGIPDAGPICGVRSFGNLVPETVGLASIGNEVPDTPTRSFGNLVPETHHRKDNSLGWANEQP